MRRILLSLGLFVLLCAPALAGQLFPPENSAACGSGKVLKWSGDSVVCVDPLDQATITCPAGQVMKGVTNGVPDCVTPTAGTSLPALSCPAGQALSGIKADGSAICTALSAGNSGTSQSALSFICGAGQILKGISNGSAVCQRIDGGIFTLGSNCDDYKCRYKNPVTGGCSCPTNYSPKPIWEFYSNSPLYADGNPACSASAHWVRIYTCWPD